MADPEHQPTLRAEVWGLEVGCSCGWWDSADDPATARQLWLDHAGMTAQ